MVNTPRKLRMKKKLSYVLTEEPEPLPQRVRFSFIFIVRTIFAPHARLTGHFVFRACSSTC
jgi:hypothetical protein